MEPYDSKKNYFGAEGTLMCELLGEFLEFAPDLRPGINAAAYNHDVGYTGTKSTSWYGRIKNFFERRRIDNQLFSDMEDTIIAAELLQKISQKEADLAMIVADAAFTAVRAGGYQFYRIGETK